MLKRLHENPIKETRIKKQKIHMKNCDKNEGEEKTHKSSKWDNSWSFSEGLSWKRKVFVTYSERGSFCFGSPAGAVIGDDLWTLDYFDLLNAKNRQTKTQTNVHPFSKPALKFSEIFKTLSRQFSRQFKMNVLKYRSQRFFSDSYLILICTKIFIKLTLTSVQQGIKAETLNKI